MRGNNIHIHRLSVPPPTALGLGKYLLESRGGGDDHDDDGDGGNGGVPDDDIDSNGNHVDDGDYNIIDIASTSQVRARELFGEQWFLVDDHKDYDNLKYDDNLKKL